MRLLSAVSYAQGIYYFLSGIWPVVHINSFMAVTGPKTDLWLVKTLGGIIAVCGIWFFIVAYYKKIGFRVTFLGVALASAFAFSDFYFSLTNQISIVYMIDGLAQVMLIIGWLLAFYRKRESSRMMHHHV